MLCIIIYVLTVQNKMFELGIRQPVITSVANIIGQKIINHFCTWNFFLSFRLFLVLSPISGPISCFIKSPRKTTILLKLNCHLSWTLYKLDMRQAEKWQEIMKIRHKTWPERTRNNWKRKQWKLPGTEIMQYHNRKLVIFWNRALI